MVSSAEQGQPQRAQRAQRTESSADSALSAAPSTGTEAEPSGKRVIFWLFAGLWVTTAVVLVYFALITEAEFRRRIWVALVVNLMLPLIAWQGFRFIEAWRSR